MFLSRSTSVVQVGRILLLAVAVSVPLAQAEGEYDPFQRPDLAPQLWQEAQTCPKGRCQCSYPRQCIPASRLNLGNSVTAFTTAFCAPYVTYSACVIAVKDADTTILPGTGEEFRPGHFEANMAYQLLLTGTRTTAKSSGDCTSSVTALACYMSYRMCTPDNHTLPVCGSTCANVKKACYTIDDCENRELYVPETGPSDKCTGGASRAASTSLLVAMVVAGVTLALIPPPASGSSCSRGNLRQSGTKTSRHKRDRRTDAPPPSPAVAAA